MNKSELTSYRQPIFIGFFIYAFALGSLFPRIGDLQVKMGLTESMLGLSLIGLPIGLQISLLMAAKLLTIVSIRQVMIIGMPVISGAFCLAALANMPLLFSAALFLSGLAVGLIEVVINLEADRVEYHTSRRIMNRAHAFWSLGFFTTGIFGALAAQFAIPVFTHFLIFGILAAIATTIFFKDYNQLAPRPEEAASKPAFVKPSKAIMPLVYLTLAAMLIEGASIDWSVIFMRDSFNTLPIIDGMALALFAFFQFLTRYSADHFVARYGPPKVAYLCLLTMLAGTFLVSLSPIWIVALAGFACLGIGSSVIFPLSMSAAAQLTDRPAAENVAALAQISFVIFLLAPPSLGFVAEYAGIRAIFAVTLPLTLLSLFFVKSLSQR